MAIPLLASFGGSIIIVGRETFVTHVHVRPATSFFTTVELSGASGAFHSGGAPGHIAI
jgi:hypothetical protein